MSNTEMATFVEGIIIQIEVVRSMIHTEASKSENYMPLPDALRAMGGLAKANRYLTDVKKSLSNH